MMARYKIKAKLNTHQKEFLDDVTTKFLHLSTGFGGGKSFSLVLKNFQLSRLNRNIPGGCVVPSIADYKKDLLPLFEEILETNGIKYRYHKTDKWFRFPWSKGKLFIATAEKKIRGPNWGFATLNESTLITHERYKETIGRVRVKTATHPQVASSGTPEGTSHWKYEIFVEQPIKGSRIIYGDTRDNLINLNEDYIETLENSYDEIMLDAYLRGLFVNMKGNRFYYAYDPKRNDDETLEQIEGLEVHVTLDYNVSPMVANLWHVVPIVNKAGVPWIDPTTGKPFYRAFAFDQIVIEDGADIHHMSRAFFERGLDPDTTTIYPDPAGSSRNTAVEGAKSQNTVLKSLGWWKIKVKTSAPRFRTRQLAVCNLLSKSLIKLHPKKCKMLKRDLEAVEQDKATFEKIKDNPKLTHASDGMDYFVDIVFPLSGQKPDSRSIKYR
jgi:hypothetical protein